MLDDVFAEGAGVGGAAGGNPDRPRVNLEFNRGKAESVRAGEQSHHTMIKAEKKFYERKIEWRKAIQNKRARGPFF